MRPMTELAARDIMRTDVVTLRADATIEEAVATLEDHRIGGAPVLDAADALVGVLSTSDIARKGRVEEGELRTRPGEWYFASPLEERFEQTEDGEDEEFYGKEDYTPDVLGHVLVKDWMSPTVVSVTGEARLPDVCDLMLREGVHRVCVVEDGRLRGIVSTFDIVRCIADGARAAR